MNTCLGLFLAEVADKELTLLKIWLVALALSIVSFLLCRWCRWHALLAVVATVAWAAALLSELRDPDVGPAILRELGRSYVVQSYIAVFLPFVFIVFGVLPWRRNDPTNRRS